jgi:hypothetical protein
MRRAFLLSSFAFACDATDAAVSQAPPLDGGVAMDAGMLDRDAQSLRDGGGAGADAKPNAPLCSGQKLCDDFESYAAGTLTNGTTLGPWKASVEAGNGVVSVDASKAFSGTRSLKVHINGAAPGGGQLRAKPMFAPAPGTQHLYGKFRMFLEASSGTSKHWTMFGAAGIVPAGTPISGNRATYLFSVADNGGKNEFMNVFYNDQTRQDCWHHATQLVPAGKWSCVSFEADGAAIKYRAALDGQAVPSMSVDRTGDGCLNAAANAPWYGPTFEEFYIGALSFHPMTAPLDMWIDDVVVDTKPVACE